MLKDYADHIYIHTLQRIFTQIHASVLLYVYMAFCVLYCVWSHTLPQHKRQFLFRVYLNVFVPTNEKERKNLVLTRWLF